MLIIFLALYESLLTHNNALKSLQREYERHLEREKALGDILDSLRTGYNPNYQDMAVLEAVRGWEELAGLPHINDVGKESESTESTQEEAVIAEEEALEEGEWTEDDIKLKLSGLLNTDYVSLLLEHEEFIKVPIEGSICMLFSFLLNVLAAHFSQCSNCLLTCQTLCFLCTKTSRIRSSHGYKNSVSSVVTTVQQVN
jgi:protein kinase C substrate 80K-H